MPRGASAKREREYEDLKKRFKKEGRYRGREEEVASRIVNKQRAEYGETQEAKEQRKKGKSPDRNLPIDEYQRLTIDQIARQLDRLSEKQLRQVKSYEQEHKNRKTLLEKIDRQMSA